jgi:signal transduction histidine kinase
MIVAYEKGFIRTSGSLYLITGGMLTLLVWIVAFNFAAQEEKKRFMDAAEQAQRIAIYFERHVVGIFQYGDAYLKLVRREYERHYDIAQVEQLMAEIPLNNSIASHISIIDQNGTPLMVSGHEIKAGTTARDRDYFKIQKAALEDELLVSKMHRGRNTGKLSVRLVRRCEKPNGEFDGVIFLSLEVDNITAFFNTMEMGPMSSATLVGRDRFVRARSSYGPRGPGQDISGSQIWQRLEESPTGQYLQTSVVDGVTRHYAYREVPGFPLIVAIGISVDDFKESIRESRFNHYSISLLATLLVAITTFFFYRQQQLLVQIESKNIELERRADEIEHKNIELQGQNDELEQFNYTVSHDLKAPLVTIKGFLGLLRQDIEVQDASAVERDASQIGDAADRMARLLDELLELSRIGRQMNVPEWLNLNQLVTGALERVAMQIENNKVDVRVADHMPAVFGDRGRLVDVFQNLIDNAIKFMGDQQSPRIEIGARREYDEVYCYVRDNGIGIAADYQDRIFDLFDRLDARVEGTGVGLALIKRIIEVHGGRIWVESEGEGKGATFWFTLPQPNPDLGD